VEGDCLECYEGFIYDTEEKECNTGCTTGFYLDQLTSTCNTCHPFCKTCHGASSLDCYVCEDEYTMSSNGICYSECDSNCEECDEFCLKCKEDFYLCDTNCIPTSEILNNYFITNEDTCG
jgi:hypothetical protein